MNRILRILVRLRLIARFSIAGNGRDYGVGIWTRFKIGIQLCIAEFKLRKNSASTLGEQLVLVNSILALPSDAPGDIAEFGCYKGASSVALSIAAKHTGRKLIIFDSFAGLPEPDQVVHNISDKKPHGYMRGDYPGTFEEVRRNIERHGELSVVEMVKGYFNETLPQRPTGERYCLIFEDADLVSSVLDVLKFAWPRLRPDGLFFCHEARDFEVVQLFYDPSLWNGLTGGKAPGLVGAGFGLPLDLGAYQDPINADLTFNYGSCLAYTSKR